jgi:preprotein translocase subunit YajC
VLAQAEDGGVAPQVDAVGGGGLIFQFLSNPINLILISAILFMLIVVKPQQKQIKRQQLALAGLKKNDRVVTSGGIHGVVIQTSADDPLVTIRIDENSGARMTINRDSIASILNSEPKE